MRCYKLLSMLMVLAAPLAAQGFEGVVSVKMAGMGGGGNTDADFSVKGDKMVAKLIMPASAGPAAGKEGRMLVDGAAGTVTMLIPMPMGNMQGMKMVTDVRKAAENAKIEVKALGTSETIAGFKCDDFQVTEGKSVTVVCITSQLGHFAMASGMGGASAWASVLLAHPGFPLRVVANGKTNFEVTAVKPGPVSGELFVLPDGYMELPNMGGMRGGRGGGS